MYACTRMHTSYIHARHACMRVFPPGLRGAGEFQVVTRATYERWDIGVAPD